MTCKRNAFVFLANCAMPKAVEYLMSVLEQIPSLDELMQMAIIETIRKDCQNESVHRVRSFQDCLSPTSLMLGRLIMFTAKIHSVHLRAPERLFAFRKVRSRDDTDIPDPEPRRRQRLVQPSSSPTRETEKEK